jgi:Protein of unknown function (DUF2726)
MTNRGQDRRRPLLVNASEFATDAQLREAADEVRLRVDAKVRVADTVALDRAALTSEQYSYGLMAHFDWVISDSTTTRAEFAVEFDGSSHGAANAQHNDALKNEIAIRSGLPLLRIDDSVFRKVTKRTIIAYLVDSWASLQGFREGQEAGRIPEDEAFLPWFVFEADQSGDLRLGWDLSRPALDATARLHADGRLNYSIPWHAYRGRRPDDPTHAEAFAWVTTVEGSYVIGHSHIHAYSFPAVFDFELADDLAHLDLERRLERLTSGDRTVLRSGREAELALPLRFPGSGWNGGGPVAPESIELGSAFPMAENR